VTRLLRKGSSPISSIDTDPNSDRRESPPCTPPESDFHFDGARQDGRRDAIYAFTIVLEFSSDITGFRSPRTSPLAFAFTKSVMNDNILTFDHGCISVGPA
jgi:hypothetical protein